MSRLERAIETLELVDDAQADLVAAYLRDVLEGEFGAEYDRAILEWADDSLAEREADATPFDRHMIREARQLLVGEIERHKRGVAA
ncbi:MAG: hypothetical protein ABEJ58_09850 [Halodesulfurarchaeum sp.]